MSNIIATSPSDAFTIVGLLLSLASLLATFFSVQLSRWLMDLLATNSKYEAYKNSRDDDAKAARRECTAELKASYNFVPLLLTLAIAVFVWHVIVGSFHALKPIAYSELKAILEKALWAFVWCYGLLTLVILGCGYLVSFKLNAKINK